MERLPIARAGDKEIELLPSMANRHGLVSGATGTGKTVTLQVLAEGFSRIGVPVFVADVKGDLSGMAAPGRMTEKLEARLDMLGLAEFAFDACPVAFWDVFGEQGHPVRATVSDLGPMLMARLLGLNAVQAGVLNLVFQVADQEGLLLLDLEDLRAVVEHVGTHAKEYSARHGLVSRASIGAIQRGLLELEAQGADRFFGEPALDLADMMRLDARGRGRVNILAADRLVEAPKLYASVLIWLLAELFETLPEVGDLPRPKLVLFFDEAHLLFDDAPEALVDKIEQVVRLIRSKGIGVYFVTQNPLDVPERVLGQLGNRIQHALRAFTPRDQKAVRAAASTMRSQPGLDLATAITELAVGEALVSVLDARGQPTPTERAYILPPRSQIGPIDLAARRTLMAQSPLAGVYERSIDRESAYERLAARASTNEERSRGESGGLVEGLLGDGVAQALVKSAARAVGAQLGRAIVRGILGSLLGRRRR